jgi:monofunctional biosynthetic peptidoglycan transglycosylase
LVADTRNRRRAPAIAANHPHGMLPRLGRIALWVISGFIIGSILLVALYRYLPPPGTPLMLLRRVEGYGIHKSWTPIDQISANLVRAVITSEDTRFCSHHGFDWSAIETAWDRYQSRRGRLLGASTISMQTAKNVFLWPGHDWLRKAFEAYFTVLIEVAWGKQRIMEIYLNVAEWGPGIYGAEAAAQHYFHKPAAALTIGEAVRLAAVLPDPLNWSPLRPTRRVLARSAAISSNMLAVTAPLSAPCRLREGLVEAPRIDPTRSRPGSQT